MILYVCPFSAGREKIFCKRGNLSGFACVRASSSPLFCGIQECQSFFLSLLSAWMQNVGKVGNGNDV